MVAKQFPTHKLVTNEGWVARGYFTEEGFVSVFSGVGPGGTFEREMLISEGENEMVAKSAGEIKKAIAELESAKDSIEYAITILEKRLANLEEPKTDG